MKPTTRFRYIERTTPYPYVKTVRILQQWWEHTEWHAPGEWRDIPLEKEE